MKLSENMTACIDAANSWMSARTKAKFGNDNPSARVLKRRFKPCELEDMVGVTRQAIYDAEKSGRLPQPDLKNPDSARPVRLGYTLQQIDTIRNEFNTQPYRPDGAAAITISIAGGKGGCWKTATAAHFAQWLGLKGFRVLVADIDPQAHLSMYFGYHPELNTTVEDTALPFLIGEKNSLDYCVRPTAWPKIKIIPSHLQMQRIEREVIEADIPYQAHLMLYAGLQAISDDYDIIIIDGHPDLGVGTTNMIAASDIVLVATSTEVNDINSTCQLMTLIRDLYKDDNNLEITHEPVVRILPTKVGDKTSSSQQNLKDMRKFWGDMVLDNACMFTDEVGKGQRRMVTVYEQADASERSTPNAWKRATSSFNELFGEILETLVKPMWGLGNNDEK